jgi:hypothetical protein
VESQLSQCQEGLSTDTNLFEVFRLTPPFWVVKAAGMSKHERIESRSLAELEAEWSRLLPQCLEQCAGGRWGLFANSPVVSAFVDWPEAERLRSLARQIREMHASFDSVHPLCERFLHYSSLRVENIRGEPKLAAEFLEELKEQDRPR